MNGQGPVANVTSGVVSAIGTAGEKLKGPAVAGAVGAAGLLGGAVLGARAAGKPKKVMGVPIPGTGRGLSKQVGKTRKQVGKAGKQVGQLAVEVRAARKKAEEVGKAIT